MKKETRKNELILFGGPGGDVKLRGDFKRDTVWATQQEIADVFGVERSVITKHIGNLFKSDEIEEKSNVQKMHIANSDKPVSLYSLDIILAVGYRTNSATAIRFRQWATKTLREHITKGYTINKKLVGKNYTPQGDALRFLKCIPVNAHTPAPSARGMCRAYLCYHQPENRKIYMDV